MTSHDVDARIKKILLDHLEVADAIYQPGTRIVEDLGADSLDTVEMIMAIEAEFGIDIEDEAAEKVSTVCDAVELVKDHLAAKADRERQAQ